MQLSVPEILSTCHLLIVAGNLTTTDLLSNGVLALLRHPAQLARLRSQLEMIYGVVEEILRYDSPVMQLDRVAVEPRVIDGVSVEAGQTIAPCVYAANNDPAVYSDPGSFNPEREDKHHYSFGGGHTIVVDPEKPTKPL